jgi:hypothetical protein
MVQNSLEVFEGKVSDKTSNGGEISIGTGWPSGPGSGPEMF